MNIGFIGTGKISGAVIEALCSSRLEDYKIIVSPRNRDISIKLAEKYARVVRAENNQEVVDKSDAIFLALRPPVYKEVIAELKFRADHVIVSLIPFSFYNDLCDLIRPATILSRATPLPTVVTHTCPIPVFMPSEVSWKILSSIGQPFEVSSEEELHTIWTLTCLISPFYDMMNSLSEWASNNSVPKDLSDKYVADMFHTLAYAAHLSDKPDFTALSHHAATPGGLNEQTGMEIKSSGAHQAYVDAADGILKLFKLNCKI